MIQKCLAAKSVYLGSFFITESIAAVVSTKTVAVVLKTKQKQKTMKLVVANLNSESECFHNAPGEMTFQVGKL